MTDLMDEECIAQLCSEAHQKDSTQDFSYSQPWTGLEVSKGRWDGEPEDLEKLKTMVWEKKEKR